jgi:Arc/MetJ-type ribon-helix-helix transcriptional regulator
VIEDRLCDRSIDSVVCKYLSYRMRSTLTISLPAEMRDEVSRQAKIRRMTQSEFIRQAVQEKLWEDAVHESARLLTPSARAKGFQTDEDVFAAIS